MKNLVIPIVIITLLLSCETATERELSGVKPVLLAPVSNTVTTDTMQTFYWETLNGASTYQLQVVSPRFDSMIRLIDDTIITKNRFTIDLSPGEFQWRVRALNNSGPSAFSDTFNLKVQ
jgi:hypothetical protein